MRSIVFAKFNQNAEIRRKLLDTGDLMLFECTKNRWWGSRLRLDAPEWETGTYPGLNKLGTILMEVRTALRKINYTEDARIKSPGAIIKSISKMDGEIQKRMELPVLTPVEVTVNDGKERDVKRKEEDMEVRDETSSISDVDELMGETDIEEESVNISSASTSSHTSSTSKRKSRKIDLNVTDDKGKLDLSKIRGWSIPKLNRSYKSDRDERIGEKT